MLNNTEFTTAEQYNTLTQQFTKYAGIPLFTVCLYGTMMNIILFAQRIFRYRSGSIYILIASVCDLIHLSVGPLSNVLQYGYHYDWTISSVKFCKIKSYLVFVITAISATLTTLANINQYILSSKKNKRWKFNSQIIAIRCTCLTIVVWFLISIPIAFCFTRAYHSSDNEQMICSNPLNSSFCFYVQIFHACVFNGFLHPLLMVFFGTRTYINIYRIHQRSLLKSNQIRQVNYQMAMMLILQSIKSSFASLPFAIFNCYLLITRRRSKSLLYQARENIIGQLVYFLFWSNYTSFFVYIYSSNIFKEQWKTMTSKIFCCLYGQRHRRNQYQIHLNKMICLRSIVNQN